MLNALTIDVEDYFHVSNFEHIIKREDWDKYECRVVGNTRRILKMLSGANTKATFFVLGWVAERFPELIKEIDLEGHELASHGYWHKLVYDMTEDEFRKDLLRSINILEQIIGKKIIGYRAPSCSITKDSLWAIDILKENGIRYDASIFPIHHMRYGIPQAERFIHKWQNNGMVEFPFSTIQMFKKNLPVAGGGYLRLYPYRFTKWSIKKINSEGHPAMVYIHPWEIDIWQPRIKKAGFAAIFKHYVNLENNEAKLKRLLKDFNFSNLIGIFNSQGLIK